MPLVMGRRQLRDEGAAISVAERGTDRMTARSRSRENMGTWRLVHFVSFTLLEFSPGDCVIIIPKPGVRRFEGRKGAKKVGGM